MASAPRCGTCLRPVFVPSPPTGTKPDARRHCPRALAEPLSIESDQVYTVACLAIGITTRDAQLAAAKALNDTARIALIRLRDSIDLAIAGTRPEDEEAPHVG